MTWPGLSGDTGVRRQKCRVQGLESGKGPWGQRPAQKDHLPVLKGRERIGTPCRLGVHHLRRLGQYAMAM